MIGQGNCRQPRSRVASPGGRAAATCRPRSPPTRHRPPGASAVDAPPPSRAAYACSSTLSRTWSLGGLTPCGKSMWLGTQGARGCSASPERGRALTPPRCESAGPRLACLPSANGAATWTPVHAAVVRVHAEALSGDRPGTLSAIVWNTVRHRRNRCPGLAEMRYAVCGSRVRLRRRCRGLQRRQQHVQCDLPPWHVHAPVGQPLHRHPLLECGNVAVNVLVVAPQLGSQRAHAQRSGSAQRGDKFQPLGRERCQHPRHLRKAHDWGRHQGLAGSRHPRQRQ